MRFPSVSDEIIEIADCYFLDQKEKTRHIIEGNIDSEINYLFTNDENYLRNRTKLIPIRENAVASKKPEVKEKKEEPADETKEKPKEKEEGFFANMKNALGGKKDEPKEPKKE